MKTRIAILGTALGAWVLPLAVLADSYVQFSVSSEFHPEPRQEAYIVLYEFPHYQGDSLILYPGEQVEDLRDLDRDRWGHWRDRVSSVAIYGDLSVFLFSEDSFEGYSLRLAHSEPDLHRVRMEDRWGDPFTWGNRAESLFVSYNEPDYTVSRVSYERPLTRVYFSVGYTPTFYVRSDHIYRPRRVFAAPRYCYVRSPVWRDYRYWHYDRPPPSPPRPTGYRSSAGFGDRPPPPARGNPSFSRPPSTPPGAPPPRVSPPPRGGREAPPSAPPDRMSPPSRNSPPSAPPDRVAPPSRGGPPDRVAPPSRSTPPDRAAPPSRTERPSGKVNYRMDVQGRAAPPPRSANPAPHKTNPTGRVAPPSRSATPPSRSASPPSRSAPPPSRTAPPPSRSAPPPAEARPN